MSDDVYFTCINSYTSKLEKKMIAQLPVCVLMKHDPKLIENTQSEIILGLSIIMLGLRGTFGGFSVFMVGLYSST